VLTFPKKMKRGNDNITNTVPRQLLPSIDELLHGINTDIPSPMPPQNIIIPRPELFTLEYEHASHATPPLQHATPFIYENNLEPPRKKIKQQSPTFSLITTQQFQETTVHATPQFIQEYGTVPPSPNSNEDGQRKKKKSHTLDLTVQQLERRRKEDKRRSYHYLPDDCIETLKNWFQQVQDSFPF
jgi:hypothetical protein